MVIINYLQETNHKRKKAVTLVMGQTDKSKGNSSYLKPACFILNIASIESDPGQMTNVGVAQKPWFCDHKKIYNIAKNLDFSSILSINRTANQHRKNQFSSCLT